MNKYGSADVLEIREIDKPIISHDQVLIRVRYSSINPVDWKIRNGSIKFMTGFRFPMPLGFDAAGEVVEKGSGVTRFRKGDRVFCMLSFKKRGAYAEYVSAGENIVSHIPDNTDFEEAAAVPLAGLTAYQALHYRGKIERGESVLIYGASGGVGSFAVQIAKAAGAKVTGVCSTKNRESIGKLGADITIDYKKHDFTRSPDKYDIIFDTVGKLSFFHIKKNLTCSGRYITTLPNNPVNILSFFLIPVLALFGYRRKSSLINVRAIGSDLDTLSSLMKEKKLIPLIDRIVPLDDIRQAHAYSEKGHAKGKILLRIT